MPKGVYERTPEQKARIAALAKTAAVASAEYWQGRSRSEEQRAAHSALMRGRPSPLKGTTRPPEVVDKQITHGHARDGRTSPTYRSWQAMKQRCNDTDKDNYPYYGGRGIKVCDRWQQFENFLADMGERPKGSELSRLDNDRDYEPGNVVWELKERNLAERNRRNSRSYGLTESAQIAQKRTYTSWQSMLDRCRNPNFRGYALYGGRGIKVCERWNSFDVFLDDMGARPEGKVLSRLNTDRDFEPDNCRWMTRNEQIVHQRRDVGQPMVSHGMHDTPTYRAWASMKHQCSQSYYRRQYYFDAGIVVCGRWNSFEAFFEDMGTRPEGKTLGRLDSDGNFEPSNCQWMTRKEQIAYQRRAA